MRAGGGRKAVTTVSVAEGEVDAGAEPMHGHVAQRSYTTYFIHQPDLTLCIMLGNKNTDK